MNNQEFMPELRVVRIIVDMPRNLFRKMSAELAHAPGVNPADVQIQLKPWGFVSLIKTNEIFRLFEEAGEEPSRIAILSLADHLNHNFPTSFNQRKEKTSIKPLEQVPMKADGLNFGRSGEVDIYGFRSPEDEELEREVFITRRILANRFGLDPKSQETKALWYNPNAGRLLVAKVVGRENLEPVENLLDSSILLPTHVALGKVTCRTQFEAL